MYVVKHYAYTGCSDAPETFETALDARGYVADILRARRAEGFPVTILKRGREWEISEPDCIALIPDQCGVLEIKHETYSCRECGCEHENRENAFLCCEDYNA